MSKTFQYCDVDLFVLQLVVALAIQKLELMKTEPGQNLSIVLVKLEHVEDKDENAYIEMLQKKNKYLKTKHYVKSVLHIYYRNL